MTSLRLVVLFIIKPKKKKNLEQEFDRFFCFCFCHFFYRTKKKKMFFFLFSFGLSEYRTFHIGKPIHYSKSKDLIAVSTSLNEVALLNETNGQIFWKTPLEDVVSLELREDLEELLVLTKHFYYYLDKETGTITHQLVHNVKKPITASYKDKATAVIGRNSMALYNNTVEIWSTSFDQENLDNEITVHFSEDNQTIILGSVVYDAHTGDKIGEADQKDIQVFEKLDFRYEPTVLTYYKDGEQIWRIDEPLCGAELLSVATPSHLLLKNDTHLLVFNIFKESLTKAIPMHVVDYIKISPKKSLIKTPGNVYVFNHFTMDVVEAKDENISYQVSKVVKNNFIQDGFVSHIPSNCELKCAVQSNLNETTILASQCGIDSEISVINQPKVQTYRIPNATVHSCLQGEDSLYVSYARTVDKSRKEILTAFPFNSHHGRLLSFYTENTLLKVTDKHSLSIDGTFSEHPRKQLSTVVPLEANVGLSSLFSMELPASYDINYKPTKLTCVPNIHNFLDDSDKIILGGTDIFILSSSQDRSIYLSILAVYSLGAIFMAYLHYTTKEISFWK